MNASAKAGLAIGAASLRLRPMPPEDRRIADIFRRLREFHVDYDEAVLTGIAADLQRDMPEDHADRIMSDALMLNNELRFRRPGGLEFNEAGSAFATPDEEALVTLIRSAGEHGDFVAVVAAEKLGIDAHAVLRQAASLLLKSLRRGGFDVGWGAGPVPGEAGELARTRPTAVIWH